MRVDKKYNNKYTIKLNGKTLSKRNTRHKYNYCMVAIIKGKKNIHIFNEVENKEPFYWETNWVDANNKYTKSRPILFAQSKQFKKIDDLNYVINFKTTNKLKQFIFCFFYSLLSYVKIVFILFYAYKISVCILTSYTS